VHIGFCLHTGPMEEFNSTAHSRVDFHSYSKDIDSHGMPECNCIIIALSGSSVLCNFVRH